MNEITTPCTHCGNPVSDRAIYCSNCGAPAPPVSREERNTLDGHTDLLHDVGAGHEAHTASGSDEEETPPETPAEQGLFLDWSPQELLMVEDAAQVEGLTVDQFIRALVLPRAKKIVTTKKGLITLDQASGRLGVTRQEIIQMITSGKIRARKVEGVWKVEELSLVIGETPTSNREEQIELDLRQLAESSGLNDVDFDGDDSNAGGATLCYVTQQGILVCPRSAWRKLGRERIVELAKDAVRRYVRRIDHPPLFRPPKPKKH